MLPVSLPTEKCCILYISLPIGQGHHDIESPDRSAALYTHLNQLVKVIMTYTVLDTAGCQRQPKPHIPGRLDIVKTQVVTGPNLNIWASTNIIIYTSYFPDTR